MNKFYDEFENSNSEYNDRLKQYLKDFRKGSFNKSNLPDSETLEDMIHWCIVNENYSDALFICDEWTKKATRFFRCLG